MRSRPADDTYAHTDKEGGRDAELIFEPVFEDQFGEGGVIQVLRKDTWQAFPREWLDDVVRLC